MAIKHTGRPKRPGSLDFDPKTGSIRYFIGYCCHGEKVLVTPEELKKLIAKVKKEQTSVKHRLFFKLLD